jgi:hypothetical protein
MKDETIEYLRGAGSMNVYAVKFIMTDEEISKVTTNAANFSGDPFGSPVYHLRALLGV